MSHPYHHALSCVKKWGGEPEDYLPIHNWFDASKESHCHFTHRALRHHAEGIFPEQSTLRLRGPAATALRRVLRCTDCHRPVRDRGGVHRPHAVDGGTAPDRESAAWRCG